MKNRMFVLAGIFFVTSCMITLKQSLLESHIDEFDIQRGSELSFQNTNGDLEVTEWESDFVQVETFIYGDSGRGVPEDLVIEFNKTIDKLSATVDYPDGFSTCSVDFVVKIPSEMGYLVSHSTTNGDTSIIADVIADVEAVNGDIYLEVLCSRELETVNGDISAILLAQNFPLIIETVNGDIAVELSELMEVTAETVNGDITVGGIEFNGKISLAGSGLDLVEIVTVNGDIQVKQFDDFDVSI